MLKVKSFLSELQWSEAWWRWTAQDWSETLWVSSSSGQVGGERVYYFKGDITEGFFGRVKYGDMPTTINEFTTYIVLFTASKNLEKAFIRTKYKSKSDIWNQISLREDPVSLTRHLTNLIPGQFRIKVLKLCIITFLIFKFIQQESV